MAIRMLICFFIGLTISGCKTTLKQQTLQQSDPVLVKLERLAQVMVEHSNRVAELQEANYKQVNGESLETHKLHLLPQLNKIISLGAEFTGPLKPFLERLSLQSGMNRPRFLKLAPPGDIIISVNTDYRSTLDILRDVGAQTGSRAIITFKASENLLEIEYASL